jgi:hypothetical protein
MPGGKVLLCLLMKGIITFILPKEDISPMKYGKGRLVFFGEAAMFTAQLAGPSQAQVGMNSEYAEENYKLLLNIIHWLDHKFE